MPKVWKQANVSPIHKKNDPSEISNYRPISLLSTVGKVLDKKLFINMYSISFMSIMLLQLYSQVLSLAILQLINWSIYIILSVKLLTREKKSAQYFATSVRHLIGYGTGDYFLNSRQQVYLVFFYRGFLIISMTDVKELYFQELVLNGPQSGRVFLKALFLAHYYF